MQLLNGSCSHLIVIRHVHLDSHCLSAPSCHRSPDKPHPLVSVAPRFTALLQSCTLIMCSPVPVAEAAPCDVASVPAPITHESPTLPRFLPASPQVDVPAARTPFESRATHPTVPSCVCSSGPSRRSSSRRNSGIPFVFANTRAPSPIRKKCSSSIKCRHSATSLRPFETAL